MILILLLAVHLSGASGFAATMQEVVSDVKPLALVYSGPGVLPGIDDTLERAQFLAEQAGFEVRRVDAPVQNELLNRARLWVQPGGPNFEADAFMNQNGMAQQVRDFVSSGGGFIGFCGGTYSAVNNLKLLKGTARTFDSEPAKLPVNWSGKLRYIHFEYGPYLSFSDKNVEVVAQYADGTAAAARGHYGKGRVFVSGVHPEASRYWAPTEDPDGSDLDLALEMVRWVSAPFPH